jgi:lipopolysaccharide biosynthesis protein
LQRKIEEEEEMEEGEMRVAGQVINYILQTDLLMDLTDEFKSINNFVCKKNKSSYFFIFFIVIPSIYTDEIFSLVFIDGYYEGIFNQKNSPQSIDETIPSVFLFIFVKFLVESSNPYYFIKIIFLF